PPAAKSVERSMNPSIRLKKVTPPFLVALLIMCPGLSLKAPAASPPADDHLSLKEVGGRNAPSSVPGGGWNVVPSPNTGSPNNYFSGVVAIAPDDEWAVGGYGIQGDRAWQLIEHWDGTNWTLATRPAINTPNELLAVSASSANDVWAVGGFNSGGQALIEHWDGSTWQ